jgi:alkylation response protein AidB-like acyl-CoA dehydrogenase
LRACGGTGFTKSLGLERAFRDARAAAVMAPTTDVLHEFVGRALCGMELL